MIFSLRAVEELGMPRDTGQPGAGSQNQVSKIPEETKETAQQVRALAARKSLVT